MMFTALVFTYASSAAIMVLMKCLMLYLFTIKGSKRLHDSMVSKVLRAPINLFFDLTPTGTIMNRFSKDL
jgi:ATP-binding cassette subfamily C (CFTR/MRP) protein 1